MRGSKRKYMNLSLLFLVYILWRWKQNSTSVEEKFETESKNHGDPIAPVHGNEMKMKMWLNGLKNTQAWMMNPPESGFILNDVHNRPFPVDIGSCDLQLSEGQNHLNFRHFKNCDYLGNIFSANLTIVEGKIEGEVRVELMDKRICDLIFRSGLLHGLQRVYRPCVLSYKRGEHCLQLVGKCSGITLTMLV